MSFRIAGIGTAVPREMITQDDAAQLAIELSGSAETQTSSVKAIYRRAGVRKRHSAVITSSTNGSPATQSFFPVSGHSGDRGPTTGDRMRYYEDVALDLILRAAGNALDDSGASAEDIDHLVTVSCTGFSSPGVDIGLMEGLGLKRNVSRTHIGFMGCHGALNGLRVATALSKMLPESSVLLCCVELCTLHHQYAANAQQVVANALFSDGAAAVVGTNTTSTTDEWRVIDQFSYVLPETSGLMAWRIGNNGFDMRLSARVPDVIQEMLHPWLCQNLARHRLKTEDVRGWAIHPGGPRILTACADSLRFDYAYLEPSQQVLADFGNMSSPTVLFILDQLRKRGGCLPCVAIAFGPGLTIEAALLA